MAKYMNASVVSMRTILKNNLQLSPYKMRRRQLITPTQKHKRLERAKLLLGELKANTAEREIFFADEKILQIEETVNNQNDRVYAKSSTLMTP